MKNPPFGEKMVFGSLLLESTSDTSFLPSEAVDDGNAKKSGRGVEVPQESHDQISTNKKSLKVSNERMFFHCDFAVGNKC